jgi:hypothetical protein
MFILSIVAGLCTIGLLIYLLTKRGRMAVAEGRLNTTLTPEMSAADMPPAATEASETATDSD